MNYKKYVIIEPVNLITGFYDSIKVMVRHGMSNDDLKDILNVEDEWTPQPDDKLYFFPGCTVPRFKVREKFKVTIKPEYATAAFISLKGLEGSEDMFNKQRMIPIDEALAIKYFESIYGDGSYQTTKLKSILMNCENVVLINIDNYSAFYNRAPQDYNGVNPEMMGMGSVFPDNEGLKRPWCLDKEDEINFYTPVPGGGMDELNATIYSQDAILKILNEGKIVVDEKKYQELRLMGHSSDEENIVLMMEIMANSNYDKSFVYLLLLIKEFSTQIASRNEISHVNFKALLNYFELDERKVDNVSIEQLTKTMKKLKKFTRKNVQRITQFFGQENGSHNFVSDNYLTGPVLRPEAERELDDEDDCVSDYEEIKVEDNGLEDL